MVTSRGVEPGNLSSLDERFRYAVDVVHTLPQKGPLHISTEEKLNYYALYKQATKGPCEQTDFVRPSWMDIPGQYKWDAWTKLGGMDPVLAKQHYVQRILEDVRRLPETEETQAFVRRLQPKKVPASTTAPAAIPASDFITSTPVHPLPANRDPSQIFITETERALPGLSVGAETSWEGDYSPPEIALPSPVRLPVQNGHLSETLPAGIHTSSDDIFMQGQLADAGEEFRQALADLERQLNETTNRVRELEFMAHNPGKVRQPSGLIAVRRKEKAFFFPFYFSIFLSFFFSPSSFSLPLSFFLSPSRFLFFFPLFLSLSFSLSLPLHFMCPTTFPSLMYAVCTFVFAVSTISAFICAQVLQLFASPSIIGHLLWTLWPVLLNVILYFLLRRNFRFVFPFVWHAQRKTQTHRKIYVCIYKERKR